MMNTVRSNRLLILVLAGLAAGVPILARAQDDPEGGYAQQGYADQTAPAQPAVFSPPQLEQLAAPIALYPDPLIAQILMASVYPLEIVEAQRWLQDPNNAGLHGDALAAALDPLPWDPSVKSLVPFPQVIATMNQNLEWTEQLGDAFLAQQADVMNAVQLLRVQAVRNGALRSTPQQVVSAEGPVVVIQPADPATVYVPYYDPQTIYGSWQYPAYEPYVFTNYDYQPGIVIGFGAAIGVIGPLWAWHHWDWRAHRIDIDNGLYARLNAGRPPPRPGVWHFSPDHRRGVPFREGGMRGRFAPEAGNPAARGYAPGTAGPRGAQPNAPERHGPAFDPGRSQPGARFDPGGSHPDGRAGEPHAEGYGTIHRPPTRQSAPISSPNLPQRPVVTRGPSQQVHAEPVRAEPVRAEPARMSPPAFASFQHGADARAQEMRGAQSRGAPQPHGGPGAMAHAGAPHAGGGPAAGGAGGGHGGGRP